MQTGISAYGRTLAVGDYILWNNMTAGVLPGTSTPQYQCEIDQVTGVTLNSLGAPGIGHAEPQWMTAGYGFFGTIQAAQSGVFWRLVDKFWQIPLFAALDPIKLPWAGMCVAAVNATYPGAATRACQPAAFAGHRALNAAGAGPAHAERQRIYQRVLGLAGGYRIGGRFLLPINGPESIRSALRRWPPRPRARRSRSTCFIRRPMI